MKIILCIAVMSVFAVAGYKQKYLIGRQLCFFEFLENYAKFCNENISLFKNNLVSITDNYIIMHKNKNAKFCSIFVKSNNCYSISEDLLKKLVPNSTDYFAIFEFLKTFGLNDYEFEKERICSFLNFLSKRKTELETAGKTKANLRFKLFLALGAVISIILW